MTQAQTTADRIFELMREIRLWDAEHDAMDHRAVAQTIAAEIDALKADNAQANQWLVNGVAKIAELEKQRDEARAIADARVGDLMNANGIYIDELKAQLAEARAEVESCRKAYAQMRSTEDEWKRDTLAALKAEVERLRPAAALGNAYLASINEDADDNDVADLQDALEVAADRAREAAKERKP